MESKIVKQDIPNLPTKKHRGNPSWVKGGVSPNPKGARLGQERLSALFTKAFLNDAEKRGEDLFEYAFKRATAGNDRVLVALLNKFMPDLLKGEGFGAEFTNITGFDADTRRELVAVLRKRRGIGESIKSD